MATRTVAYILLETVLPQISGTGGKGKPCGCAWGYKNMEMWEFEGGNVTDK